MLQQGSYNGQRIIPQWWIDDICSNGDGDAWKARQKGPSPHELPGYDAASYRSYWWVASKSCGRYAAIGLGGQAVVIDPVANMVVVKLSSPPDAATGEDIKMTQFHGIDAIIRALADHGC